MPRPVCLFTGQWADLPLETLAAKAAGFGYDGLELACWGDHFDVQRALREDDYCQKHWALLSAHGLGCYAISSHLVGQAVCDLIDERHKAILQGLTFFGCVMIVVVLVFFGLTVASEWFDSKMQVTDAEHKAEAIRIIGKAAREYPEGAAFILGEKHGE